jgi:hypothetical protein
MQLPVLTVVISFTLQLTQRDDKRKKEYFLLFPEVRQNLHGPPACNILTKLTELSLLLQLM